MALLQARHVPAGVVQNAQDMLDKDEHMKAREYYWYLDHPETGRSAYDGPPMRLSATPGQLRAPRRCSANTRWMSVSESSASTPMRSPTFSPKAYSI